jgi:thiosulfate dehydrogenase [quinone] large subunit
MNPTTPLFDRRLAYGIFRLTMGVNMLIHGAVRIFGPGVGAFAAGTEKAFTTTALPYGMVHSFLVFLPYAELILGASITVGFLTRWGLALGGLLMTALVFGTSLRSDWATVGLQMVYALLYYLLLANIGDDYFSLDRLFGKKGDV